MDQELAQKIVEELSRFSSKNYAVTDIYGIVMAKSIQFSINHNPLDIKSKRSFPIVFDTKRIGYLYIDENLNSALESGKILKSMADLITHQNFYTKVISSDEKRVDSLLYDLLKNEEANINEIKRTLNSLGINLDKNRVAIVIEISDPKYLFFNEPGIEAGEREKKIARAKKEIKFLLSSIYTHYTDDVISYIGSSELLILKDIGVNPEDYQEEFFKTINSLFFNLKEELRTDLTLGIGPYKKGFLGQKESYEEAQTALRFGKQNWGTGKIYYFDKFGVVAPLFSGVNERNITFSQDIIEKLKKHPDLLESLSTYLNLDISLSKTAKKLKIHRNTLVYRLEKITEVTGLDPRIFDDAFQLQLALILNKYLKETYDTKK